MLRGGEKRRGCPHRLHPGSASLGQHTDRDVGRGGRDIRNDCCSSIRSRSALAGTWTSTPCSGSDVGAGADVWSREPIWQTPRPDRAVAHGTSQLRSNNRDLSDHFRADVSATPDHSANHPHIHLHPGRGPPDYTMPKLPTSRAGASRRRPCQDQPHLTLGPPQFQQKAGKRRRKK